MSGYKQKRWNYYFVLITTWAAAITWFINYMYHPMMIRYLNSSDFAIFQSLMSMFNIFGVVSAWVSMYLIQQFSIYSENTHKLLVLKQYRSSFAKTWWCIIFLFFVLLSPLLTAYLHIPSFWLIVLVAISYLFTWYGIVFSWILHGTQKFEYIASLLIIWALSRVTFWASAMWLDLGVAWAIAAVSLGSICGVCLQYLLVKKIEHKAKKVIPQEIDEQPVEKIRQQLWPISFFTVVAVTTMLLSQIDIFVVQHSFYGNEAWIYVAISVLAKFIFFLAWSIETVYYPQFTKTLIHAVSRKQIRNYFILLSLIIGGWYVWSWAIGEYVLYLFKPTLVPYLSRLQRLLLGSWSVFIYTTILKLLIARKQHTQAYILIWLWFFVMIALHLMPQSIAWFVLLYTWTMSWLALSWLFIFWYTIRNPQKHSIH